MGFLDSGQRDRHRSGGCGQRICHLPTPARANGLSGQRNRALDLQKDYRAAWGQDLGRIQVRSGMHLQLHPSGQSNHKRGRTDRKMKTIPEILMVDDNPADIDLTSEILAQSKGHFHVSSVMDGAEAISFLRQQGKYAEAPVPDLVVLDLNLPRKNGRNAQLRAGSELLFAKAGKSSRLCGGGAVDGNFLAGFCQPAAKGEKMSDQSTHVLLIEDNPGDADL